MAKKNAAKKETQVEEKTEQVPAEQTPETQTSTEPEKPRVYTKKIPWWILIKLLFFTALLFGSPIYVYFYTQEHYFKYEPIYSAICAVVAVNIVLILYIISAALSDRPKKDDKKKN